MVPEARWIAAKRETVDTDLVRRAQRGDREAFGVLASGIGERMRRVAYGILRDAHLAEDATQQAALDMWRDLPQLRDPSRFDAWSYRVLVRACHAEGRESRRWLSASPSMSAPALGDAFATVADRDQLERAFRRLPVEQRAVVVMRHYVGLPLDAIADALEIPTGTVNSRLHRAMEALRAVLEADARPLEPSPPRQQEVTR